MANTEILTDSKYKLLLTDLRKILQEGRTRAEEATGHLLIETYWQLGKRIAEEKLIENAGYGDSILEDLAEDLRIDEATVRRSLDFFHAYSDFRPTGRNLTWSHYRELLALSDETERDWYERRAAEEGWSRDQLAQAIRRGAYQADKSPKKNLKLKRPTEPTYVYKAVVERIVDGDTLILRIDLGFQVWKEQRVRLAGIDCAPIDEKKGYEAFEFVRDQLAKVPFVMVRTHKIDVHGRYVGDLFYSDAEKNLTKVFAAGRYLNQEILDRGLARLV